MMFNVLFIIVSRSRNATILLNKYNPNLPAVHAKVTDGSPVHILFYEIKIYTYKHKLTFILFLGYIIHRYVFSVKMSTIYLFHDSQITTSKLNPFGPYYASLLSKKSCRHTSCRERFYPKRFFSHYLHFETSIPVTIVSGTVDTILLLIP